MASSQYDDLDNVHVPGDGLVVPDGWGLQIRDNQRFLYSPPGVKVRRIDPDTIPTGDGNYHVSFNAADDWDTDNFHSPVTNPEQVIIPTGLEGIYRVDAQVCFDQTSGANHAFCEVVVDDYYPGLRQSVPGIQAHTIISISGELWLQAGEAVKMRVYQDSGVTRTINPTNLPYTCMSLRWMAPLQ